MSDKLKPCPFCGGEAEYSKIDTSKTVPFGTMQHFVTCKKNCLEGLYARGNTKEEAIEEWNKRPNPWHTGTPTEEGYFYAVICRGWKRPYNRLAFVEEGKIYCLDDCSDYEDFPHEVVAWQKIEPYEAST